jgi:ATP-dependent DNA ligase
LVEAFGKTLARGVLCRGNRSLWRKAKWLNRQEFVIVGWSDPEGSRPHLGARLLGHYTDEGKLTYAGRVGTGCP